MKKLFNLLLITLFMFSCNFQETKKQLEKCTTEKNDLVKTKKDLENTKQILTQDLEKCETELVTLLTELDYGYYVVVGSFLTLPRAQKWTKEINGYGFNTKILETDPWFYVYVKGGHSKDTSWVIANRIRSNIIIKSDYGVSPRAWVFEKK
jgi:hypothetical protein